MGFGETQFYRTSGHADVQPFFNAQLAGRSVVGINAGYTLQVFGFLKPRNDVLEEQIGAIAVGATGPAMLHAAAFEENLDWVVPQGSLSSYSSIAQNQFYKVDAKALVAGALTAYDLPDLIASLAARKCVISNAKNHLDEPGDPSVIKETLEVAQAAYTARQSRDKLLIARDVQSLSELARWCAGRDDD